MNPYTVGQRLGRLPVSVSPPGPSEERTQRNVSDVVGDHYHGNRQWREAGLNPGHGQRACPAGTGRRQLRSPRGVCGEGQFCRGGWAAKLSWEVDGGARLPLAGSLLHLHPLLPGRMWLHYLDVPFGDTSYHLSATFILALVSRSSQGTGVSGLLREQGETPGLV